MTVQQFDKNAWQTPKYVFNWLQERFRCEGHKSKEFYLLTDQNDNEVKYHWYTPSCGWFILAEVQK